MAIGNYVIITRQWCQKRASKTDQWCRRFGLWDALRQSRWPHWWNASVEFFITLIFALLPIAIPFIALPMFGRSDLPLSKTFHDQIRHGELYLLSTALLAPIYYFTFPQTKPGVKTSRIFPSQQLLILIFICTICVSVLAIAATKVQASKDGIPDQMIKWSLSLFWFCCLTYFLTLVIRNSLPETVERNLDRESIREQQDFPPPNPVPPNVPPVDADAMIREVISQHSQPNSDFEAGGAT